MPRFCHETLERKSVIIYDEISVKWFIEECHPIPPSSFGVSKKSVFKDVSAQNIVKNKTLFSIHGHCSNLSNRQTKGVEFLCNPPPPTPPIHYDMLLRASKHPKVLYRICGPWNGRWCVSSSSKAVFRVLPTLR